ncbi:MAG: cation:proton antiporter [Treponema sp.]|jgi:Kef-type K+ transport system membrane component KefB/mannitol/fructose-specific phosphotransferase system IIA component (Ntr-type)|nr:cation:proton antiporter [Treponema sp.]
MDITSSMAELVLQIGIILFAVRLGEQLAKKARIPSVLGELLIGVVIGPYALGSIAIPGFPHGIFPLGENSSLAVSPELYAFATVASIILLFVSGLDTDLGLFLRYSVAGGLIGLGGALVSFAIGAGCGVLLLHTSFFDPRCLFFGILSTATSVGITARILNDQKKMDSPEGVTILAAAVFDDVLGIVMLAVVLGIVSMLTGTTAGSFPVQAILGIAGKALGIWLGFTALGLFFSRRLASLLKIFKHSYDFSILALGLALVLAGFFEKQGLAMIIGAYIAGLSLSKTDIAAVIQGRIQGLYEFFVPLFFAVMGMMVNVREIFSAQVLIFGGVYTLAAVLAKIFGCGGPALLLGFNVKGALRIGVGMVPRGEVALIIAGIGLASGVLDNQLFSIAILLTLLTTVVAPPLLSATLKISGQGTKKPVKDETSVQWAWEFDSNDIADLVTNRLQRELRAEGFFVQEVDVDAFISLARKGDISLSITGGGSAITVKTSKSDMPFVKNAVYETILTLSESIQKLKDSADPSALKKELLDSDARAGHDLLSLIEADCITLNLWGKTKEEVIAELVDLLFVRKKVLDRDMVIADVMKRETLMSTGMERGIALPHGKSDGVKGTVVAVGIKREGVPFDSMDGQPSRIFILEVSPKNSGPHVQFLSAIGAKLKDEEKCQALINAVSVMQVVELLS